MYSSLHCRCFFNFSPQYGYGSRGVRTGVHRPTLPLFFYFSPQYEYGSRGLRPGVQRPTLPLFSILDPCTGTGRGVYDLTYSSLHYRCFSILDPSTGTGREVYDLAYSGLHYLTQRVEFWRQQKPMYARSSTKPRKPGLLSLPGKGKMTKLVMVELHKIDRGK